MDGWKLADHPKSYLDTVMKTGSESIEAIMCRRWILFAGFVARMADTRLPIYVVRYVMFGELIRSVDCVGRQENEWIGCILDHFLEIISVLLTPTSVDDSGTRGDGARRRKQVTERSVAKWIAAEKVRAEPRHAVVCLNVTGRARERKG